MISIVFSPSWDTTIEEFNDRIQRLTPEESGEWGNVRVVSDPDEAEYHIVLNGTNDIPSGPTFVYCLEPPVIPHCECWGSLNAAGEFPAGECPRPQIWHVGRSREGITYDTLKRMDPPEKTHDLSWITTDKGRTVSGVRGILRRVMLRRGYWKFQRKPIGSFNFPTDGHILRMNFLNQLIADHPSMIDLYGRGDFSGPYYKGEIDDKWDALAPYRYSLAIENHHGPNYFSEKIVDALLAWCLPIYWGCTNIEEYLPKRSYIEIDIEDSNAPDKIRKILKEDPWEDRLDAIAEARQRILDEHQLFPTVEQHLMDFQRN